MEYKYVTTPSHTFSKILSHIQKGAEENNQEQIDALFLPLS